MNAARDKEAFKQLLPKLSASGLGSGGRQAIILLDPLVARDFAESFDTKEKFNEWLGLNPNAPARGAGGGAGPSSAFETLVVGGEANPCLTIGDFSYVSSASIDKWR